MRRSITVLVASAWGVGLGGTFGVLLPVLLGYWQFRYPLPLWMIAQVAGAVFICLGFIPIVSAFVEFIEAGGTPVPVAAPPRLVISDFYRYVRNPIYVGFLIVLVGQALLFGSLGLVIYAAAAWCVGATAVRFYEEPRLAGRFGSAYRRHRHAVRAWIPRIHAWTPPKPVDAN